MAFNLTAKWSKRDTHRTPDTVSRYPVWVPHQSDSLSKYNKENLPELSVVEIKATVSEDNHNNVQM